jgi:predicted restriction endonuclease
MKTVEEILNGVGVYVYDDNVPMAMDTYAEQFKPKWVSINDSLPVIGSDVLAIDNTAGMSGRSTFHEVVEYIGIDEIKSWKTVDYHWETQERELTYFTHWMPLPEPPKE